jgi:hypothetical protein
LIDFENVQPHNLTQLQNRAFKVMVFVGDKQAKIAFDLAVAIQTLGERAEYIKIEGNGLNALDFHIAFYIGQLAAQNKQSHFHIISKDTGFDPLIRHLKSKNIAAERREDLTTLAAVPTPQHIHSATLKASSAPQASQQHLKPEPIANPVAAAIKFLQNTGNPRPKTVKSLMNLLDTRLQKKFDQNGLNILVKDLIARNVVVVDGDKVSYPQPAL